LFFHLDLNIVDPENVLKQGFLQLQLRFAQCQSFEKIEKIQGKRCAKRLKDVPGAPCVVPFAQPRNPAER